MSILKVLSYNIHHALSLNGSRSLPGIIKTIQASEAELIGLQETDKFLPRSCFQNQVVKVAKTLKMDYVFAPTCRWLFFMQYGIAILSAYPILKNNNFPLPGKTEPRILLQTLIRYKDQEFYFLTTHLGLKATERIEQAIKIRKEISLLKIPVILCGDFNTSPATIEYKIIYSALKGDQPAEIPPLRTFPSKNPVSYCDYILTSFEAKILSIKTIESIASDHLPLLAEVKI